MVRDYLRWRATGMKPAAAWKMAMIQAARPPQRGPVKVYTASNGVQHRTTQGEPW